MRVTFYYKNEDNFYNYAIDTHHYKHKVIKDICTVCDGIEGLMSKKEIKRNWDNFKGKGVIHIYNICLYYGINTEINNMSRVNHNSKGGGSKEQEAKVNR